jgi:hypothetical protein
LGTWPQHLALAALMTLIYPMIRRDDHPLLSGIRFGTLVAFVETLPDVVSNMRGLMWPPFLNLNIVLDLAGMCVTILTGLFIAIVYDRFSWNAALRKNT